MCSPINTCSSALRKLKNNPGKRKNKRDIPPVRAKEMILSLFFSMRIRGFVIISFSAKIANKGIQNSATTRILDTVLNLLYIGKYSIKNSVSGKKFFPHDKSTVNIVAASIAHFKGPLTIKQPNMKSNMTNAPTYTGPAVPG